MKDWLFGKLHIIRDSDYVQPENLFWASDLIMCRRKREYRIKKVEVPFKIDASTYGRVIGILAHKGAEVYLKEDGWETEVKKRKEFGDYIVSAKADAIKGDQIIEIKYQRYFKGALAHHLIQLGVYLNIFEKDIGRLLYVTMNDIVDFTINSKASDDNILWLIENGMVPFADWECKYCEYKEVCDK